MCAGCLNTKTTEHILRNGRSVTTFANTLSSTIVVDIVASFFLCYQEVLRFLATTTPSMTNNSMEYFSCSRLQTMSSTSFKTLPMTDNVLGYK